MMDAQKIQELIRQYQSEMASPDQGIQIPEIHFSGMVQPGPAITLQGNRLYPVNLDNYEAVIDRQFELARASQHGTLVMRITTPGGTPDTAYQLARYIELKKRESEALGTPVRVIGVADDMTASAGMMIMSAADEVHISSDAAIFGSIGVYSTHRENPGNRTYVVGGEMKVTDPNHPLWEAQETDRVRYLDRQFDDAMWAHRRDVILEQDEAGRFIREDAIRSYSAKIESWRMRYEETRAIRDRYVEEFPNLERFLEHAERTQRNAAGQLIDANEPEVQALFGTGVEAQDMPPDIQDIMPGGFNIMQLLSGMTGEVELTPEEQEALERMQEEINAVNYTADSPEVLDRIQEQIDEAGSLAAGLEALIRRNAFNGRLILPSQAVAIGLADSITPSFELYSQRFGPDGGFAVEGRDYEVVPLSPADLEAEEALEYAQREAEARAYGENLGRSRADREVGQGRAETVDRNGAMEVR